MDTKYVKHSVLTITYGFSLRIINAWNSLLRGIVDFASLSALKPTVTFVDFTDYLKIFA